MGRQHAREAGEERREVGVALEEMSVLDRDDDRLEHVCEVACEGRAEPLTLRRGRAGVGLARPPACECERQPPKIRANLPHLCDERSGEFAGMPALGRIACRRAAEAGETERDRPRLAVARRRDDRDDRASVDRELQRFGETRPADRKRRGAHRARAFSSGTPRAS